MAKGQKRSGREPKKPKQDKTKGTVVSHTTTAQDLIKQTAPKGDK